MIRSTMIASIILLGLLAWYAQQVTTEVQKSSPRKPVASIKEIHGDVLVRSLDQNTWRHARFNVPLYAGDTVYIGADSRLVYSYLKESATITIPSNSISEVTGTAAVAHQVTRQFYSAATIGDKEGTGQSLRNNRIYVRMQQSPINQTSGSVKASVGEELSAENFFSIERRAQAIRVLEPRGNTVIETSSLPLTMRIILQQPHRPVRIFGYLWKQGQGSAPVWTEVLDRHEFSDIPLAQYGDYVFQAISEDDAFVSPLIPIVVRQATDPSQAIGQAFRTESWDGKQVLVLR